MAANKQPFDLALTITRAGTLFTTHTPVAAGFDMFEPGTDGKSISKIRGRTTFRFRYRICSPSDAGIRNDSSEPFNMAYLAIRGSGGVNGVSKLHGQVSRRIFQVLFPRWPEVEVPVTHVTNGVHMPTWDLCGTADRLWESAAGKDRWRGTMDTMEMDLRGATDSDLWQMRGDARKSLVEYVRKTNARQLGGRGASGEDLAQAAQVLDSNALTLGFARRFAPYKAADIAFA